MTCLLVAAVGTAGDGPDHTTALQQYYAKPSALEASEGGFPAIFLSFPSTKDSEWSERFPSKSTAHIIAEARLEWFQEWREGTTLVSCLHLARTGCCTQTLLLLVSGSLHVGERFAHVREWSACGSAAG
jgi:hypothetical protein